MTFQIIKKLHIIFNLSFWNNFCLFVCIKRNGVFLELGANDGESMSHTLDLEMNLGWSGLLIECNPEVVPDLRQLGRKAWLAMVCVSNTTHPQRVIIQPLKISIKQGHNVKH
jgi:hypothetical protein